MASIKMSRNAGVYTGCWDIRRLVGQNQGKMSSGARLPGKVVPWTCQQEWIYAKDCLYGADNNSMDTDTESRIRKGLDLLKVWTFRGMIPTAVEATGNLLFLQLRLRRLLAKLDAKQIMHDDDGWEVQALRLAITMALVRFVNEMVDPLQKGTYAQPITKLAEQIGLPRNLVDLRHDGTHDELPSLGILELALAQSLAWLKENYWDPSAQQDEILLEKCTDILARLKEQLRNDNEKKQSPQKQTSKMLNGIEHLQVSRQVQRIFSRALAEFCKQEAFEGNVLFQNVMECLSSWTRSFAAVLHEYIMEAKVELSSDYLYAISDCIPDSLKTRTTERPASGLLNKLLAPKPPVDNAVTSTDSLLDETALMLRKLEERRQQKKARIEEPAKTGLPEWRLVEDWVPVELGAPIDFRHFL